jgi:hypothetical protein
MRQQKKFSKRQSPNDALTNFELLNASRRKLLLNAQQYASIFGSDGI